MNPTTGKEVMDDPYMVLSNGELVSVDERLRPTSKDRTSSTV